MATIVAPFRVAWHCADRKAMLTFLFLLMVQIACGSSTCAAVRIRIEQDAILTRQAFRPALEIMNEDAGMDIHDVSLELLISRDVGGQDLVQTSSEAGEDLFAIVAPESFSDVQAESAETYEWTLIPRDSAAPAEAVRYWVAGELSYTASREPADVGPLERKTGDCPRFYPFCPSSIISGPHACKEELFCIIKVGANMFSMTPHIDPVGIINRLGLARQQSYDRAIRIIDIAEQHACFADGLFRRGFRAEPNQSYPLLPLNYGFQDGSAVFLCALEPQSLKNR